ncbi:MAG: ribonuclease PH [Candidatus Omnitrophota bacterium]
MRKDGRLANAMRKVSLETGYIKYAEGSCMIELGNTKVICTASIEDGVPIFLRGQGTGWLTAEYGMLPRSCQKRVARESSKGGRGGRTYEIQRLVGRALRSVTTLELIGERTIWMDCDVIQADGGTRCASITGSFVALCLALNVLKKQGEFRSIPVNNYIAAVSVGIVGGNTFLDLNYDEDSQADVDMNVVMTDSGKFVEVQGTAEKEPFSRTCMDEMMKLAKKGVDHLVKEQRTALKGVLDD